MRTAGPYVVGMSWKDRSVGSRTSGSSVRADRIPDRCRRGGRGRRRRAARRWRGGGGARRGGGAPARRRRAPAAARRAGGGAPARRRARVRRCGRRSQAERRCGGAGGGRGGRGGRGGGGGARVSRCPLAGNDVRARRRLDVADGADGHGPRRHLPVRDRCCATSTSTGRWNSKPSTRSAAPNSGADEDHAAAHAGDRQPEARRADDPRRDRTVGNGPDDLKQGA